MATSTLTISEKHTQRTAFEQELDAYLAEVKASIMVRYEENPQVLNDPYAMYGRLQKETLEVGIAISERHPSKLKQEVFDVSMWSALANLKCKNVRATDLI